MLVSALHTSASVCHQNNPNCCAAGVPRQQPLCRLADLVVEAHSHQAPRSCVLLSSVGVKIDIYLTLILTVATNRLTNKRVDKRLKNDNKRITQETCKGNYTCQKEPLSA